MSGTVDTSIPLSAGKGLQQTNPLATIGQFAQTTNALNQNRMFQQQYAARQGLADAYQQAVNPQTGQLDENALMGAIAKDPRVAWMGGELAQQAQQRALQQQQISAAQYNNTNMRLTGLQSRLAGLLASPNATQADVIKAGVDWMNQMNSDPQHPTVGTGQVVSLLSTMPNDPKQLRGWLQQAQLNTMDAKGRLDAIYGNPMAVNTGGNTTFVRTPAMGPATVQGSLPNTMSPDTAGTPTQTGITQGGAPIMGTRQQFVNTAGGAPTELGTGRYNSAPEGTAPAGEAPQGTPLPAPGIVTGLGPGATAAAGVTGQQNANQAIELQKAASNVPQQKATLGNLESALTQFTSGPAAEWEKVGKSFANQMNPFGNIFSPQSIASQEEFGKQAYNLAQQQFQTLGGTGTDAKLSSTMHTSPNELLSKQGNSGIIQLLKGNADAIGAMNNDWQTKWLPAHGGDTSTYGQFVNQFNKAFDPRVFQSVYMNPDQRQTMLKGLNKAEIPQFKKAYNTAVDSGWIPDPRAPAPEAGNAGQ